MRLLGGVLLAILGLWILAPAGIYGVVLGVGFLAIGGRTVYSVARGKKSLGGGVVKQLNGGYD